MPLPFRKGRKRARRGNRGENLPGLQDEGTEDKEGDEAQEAPVGVLAASGTPASGRGRPPTVPAEKNDEEGEELQDGGVTIQRRACRQHGGENMWRACAAQGVRPVQLPDDTDDDQGGDDRTDGSLHGRN